MENVRKLQDYDIQNYSTIHVLYDVCTSQFLTVFIQDGTTIKLTLGVGGDTIARIKHQIWNKEGIDVSCQCIKDCNGVVLENHVFINPSETCTRDGKFVNVFDRTLIQDYRFTDVLHLTIVLPNDQQESRVMPRAEAFPPSPSASHPSYTI
ncbi:hypothetical protein GEMRC1_012454 [Eukaryota sp. GEM-RC1]